MSCTPCRQELGDRPHHVMTDETLPSFGCREAKDPLLLFELSLFPTLHLFPCYQTRLVSTSPCATDEIPPVSVYSILICLFMVGIAVSARTG
ncbi:Uncharacterized protein APZ42_004217 [Daphnia magna]|uniref:Uncharacterized protein n=1 Tax=Daphnia magna TaxID=35525 RepID=A0A164H719_9CRUS|nr:Uncharacterized protein APZ42_004217 [Daphnia magna]